MVTGWQRTGLGVLGAGLAEEASVPGAGDHDRGAGAVLGSAGHCCGGQAKGRSLRWELDCLPGKAGMEKMKDRG